MPTDRLIKLEKLLALDPSDAFVLYGIAQEHAKAGDLAQATAFFDRCLTIDPNYLYAYYHKAKLQADHEHIQEAAATLRTGIVKARALSDAKALNELNALLDTLE